MSVEAEGNAAITGLNGKDVDARTLNVNEARPKGERASGGGGYRRPAAFAAAPSSTTFAPGSVGSRKLMIDMKSIF
jgi:hypothetical protein